MGLGCRVFGLAVHQRFEFYVLFFQLARPGSPAICRGGIWFGSGSLFKICWYGFGSCCSCLISLPQGFRRVWVLSCGGLGIRQSPQPETVSPELQTAGVPATVLKLQGPGVKGTETSLDEQPALHQKTPDAGNPNRKVM